MNEILKELSWPLKLKVLNVLPEILDKAKHPNLPQPIDDDNHRKDSTFPPPQKVPVVYNADPLHGESPIHAQNQPIVESEVTSELPSPARRSGPGRFIADHEDKLTTLAQKPVSDVSVEMSHRRVGVERLTARRDDAQDAEDDNDMRLKLFRLMYETVRDSDLKVKRAELIKDHYVNSTTFEIGYLIGDITDKASIISDISMTLKRFYSDWKPIEHINAYEQIANQAIEITHLIDLVRIVNKKDKDSGSGARSYVFKKK